MKQYLDMLRLVLEKGEDTDDRTGIGTKSIFGHQEVFDLADGYPLLTTKKMAARVMIEELLWFISGETRLRPLLEKNVNIWNGDAFRVYKKSEDYSGETIDEFVEKVKKSDRFAEKHGDLGPIYGKQWRDFGGIDQLAEAVEIIKKYPKDRRIIVSAWNPAEIPEMVLPPCHVLYQFKVRGKDLDTLDCLLYQRSCDLILGVPFNIASYALLLSMVAQVTGKKPGRFIHTYGDLHIYKNHIDAAREQLEREPLKLPKVELNPEVNDLFKFKSEDIKIVGYKPHEKLKTPVLLNVG